MCCTAVWNLEFPRGSGGQNIWSTGSLCHSADSPPPPCSLPPAPRPVPGTGHWPMSGENLRKWSQEKLRAYCCFTFVKSEKVDSVVQVGTLRTETGHMTLSLPCPWVLVNYHKLKWPLVLNRGLSFYQAPDISKRREGQCWFCQSQFQRPPSWLCKGHRFFSCPFNTGIYNPGLSTDSDFLSRRDFWVTADSWDSEFLEQL